MHAPNQALCDDGNACTLGDTCAGGTCAWLELLDCNDDNPCTADICTPAGGCANTPLDTPCNDGDQCTAGDHCTAGQCVPGLPVNCQDDNVCTDDSCDHVLGCIHAPNIEACDDGNSCTTGDQCSKGLCKWTELTDCHDGNPCTDDSCDPVLGCVYKMNQVPCDDTDPCTINDVCNLGECISGVTLYCNDNNPCTQDACKPGVGCEFTPAVGECDDGNDCTVGDHCQAGACIPTDMMDCDDNNICTKDACLADGGCQNDPVAGPCEDGSVCTLGDTCAAGECQSGSVMNCSDDNVCTQDSCNPVTGCLHDVLDVGCSDGNPCTLDDWCVLGKCLPGGPMDCDDSNVCTADVCDPEDLCVNTPVEGECSDNDLCTVADTCVAGECQSGAPQACQDGNVCTQDTCEPDLGCVYPPIVPCCSNGALEQGEQCDDGNLNNGDGCDSNCQEETGACFQNWLVGTPCNGVNHGNGCVPSDTGYHYVGIHEGYACWWHHKNQAWNTSTSSNFWHLALQFEITPGVGKCSWCHNKFSTPNPSGYSSCDGYFSPSQVGAWGWCAESDNNSAGFVCIPSEGHVSCP